MYSPRIRSPEHTLDPKIDVAAPRQISSRMASDRCTSVVFLLTARSRDDVFTDKKLMIRIAISIGYTFASVLVLRKRYYCVAKKMTFSPRYEGALSIHEPALSRCHNVAIALYGHRIVTQLLTDDRSIRRAESTVLDCVRGVYISVRAVRSYLQTTMQRETW